jgi:sec-independent protein translocase protein TatC
MPTAFTWFLGFEGTTAGIEQVALPAMGDYLDLVMHFILAFGISFLLPVLLLLLNRAGIVTREQLSGARRYVIVGVFIIAAVATPPDVVSQLILAIPLWILFEGSLLLMKPAGKDDEEEDEKTEEASAAESPSPSGEGLGVGAVEPTPAHSPPPDPLP